MPTLVVFLGGLRGSPGEETVATARRAASLDTIEAALSSGAYDRAILATDDPAGLPSNPNLEIDADIGPFRFGARLAEVVRRHNLASVVYMGGGSVTLFSPADFAGVAKTLAGGAAVTNNSFSSDLVAFPVNDSVLAAIEPLERDNALARALQDGASLALEELPRTVATQMDIDTPIDLAILALTTLHPSPLTPHPSPPRLRDYLRSLDLDLSLYQPVLPLLTDRQAQIVVAGRVGSHAWQYLERETACRVRLFAEERGLEAESRATGARSLLGFFIESAGIERFFQLLPELGDAAFIDTRVLLAHMRIDATREDRFLSDLGHWNEVRDPFLRDFTRAAAEARVPVLLGGHSLLSGGLMALNEHAWRHHDATEAR